MAEDDKSKKVKLEFVVDAASAQRAKMQITQITQALSTLVQTAQRAATTLNAAIGGGGHGGGGGGLAGLHVTGQQSNQNSPGQASPMAKVTANAGSNVTGTLAKVVLQHKEIFRSAALGAKDSLKSMSDAVTTAINQEMRELDRLERKLKAVDAAYKAVQSGQRPGGAAMEERLMMTGAKYAYRAEEKRKNLMGLRELEEPYSSYEVIPGQKGPGMFTRMKNFFNQPLFGTGGDGGGGGGGGGGLGGGGGMLSTLARSMGLPPALMGVGGLAGVGIAGYTVLNNIKNNDLMATANEYIASATDSSRRGAMAGGSTGMLGMSIRGGKNVAAQVALNQLIKSGEAGRILGQGFSADLPTMLGSTADRAASEGPYAARARIQAGDDGSWGGLYNRNVGDSEGFNYGLNRALRDAPVQAQQELAQAVHNKVMADPWLASVQNEIGNNWHGRMSLARAAGMSPEKAALLGKGHYDAKGNFIQGSNWTSEELAGMRQGLRGVGVGLQGWAGSALSMQAGGVHNFTSLIGPAAMFGGGDKGKAFISALNSGIGRGGMDIAAGSNLAQLATGIMQNGNWGTNLNGTGLLEGLLSAGSTGNVGGDLRMAQVLQSGYGAAARSMGGQTDRLQEAINVLAVNQAMPNAGLYAQNALRGVDPGLMAQMLRTGKVSDVLSDRGVGIGDVRAYASARNEYSYTRYIQEQGNGTAVGDAVSKARSMGTQAYLEDALKKGGKSGLRKAVQLLGRAHRDTGVAGTDAEGEGMVTWEAMGNTALMKAIKNAGGAHDPVSKKSLEAAGKEAKDKEDATFEAELQKRRGQILEGLKTSQNVGEALRNFSLDLEGSGQKLLQNLDAIAEGLIPILQKIDPARAAAIIKEQNAKKPAKPTLATRTTDSSTREAPKPEAPGGGGFEIVGKF